MVLYKYSTMIRTNLVLASVLNMVKVTIENGNLFASNNIIKFCFIIGVCFVAYNQCNALPGKLKKF